MLMLPQLGYEEDRKILIIGKYTHRKNVIMLARLKFLHF
jgi:hypothetical protein